MLHLPGLRVAGEMDKVRRATRDMSLAVRVLRRGERGGGRFFQISNQTTLGKTETAVIGELEREIIPQVVAYERAARRVLLDKRRRLLGTKSSGRWEHCATRLLPPEEAIMLLSDVRLGVLVGLIQDVTHQQVNQLVLLTQPAHLQRALGREMDQGERREAWPTSCARAAGRRPPPQSRRKRRYRVVVPCRVFVRVHTLPLACGARRAGVPLVVQTSFPER